MGRSKQGLITLLIFMGITGAALAYMKVNDPAEGVPAVATADTLTITTTMAQDKVLKGSDGRVSVALNLAATDIEQGGATPAQPVDLVVVLDRSGSMEGQKMGDAKEALLALFKNMHEQDRISLITYSDSVEVVSPLVNVSSATLKSLSRKVEKIHAGGGTNLGGGLQSGLAELRSAATVMGNRQRKMILVSDGHANQGIIDPTALGLMAANGAEYRAAISTVGVGHGFNELVMTTIADHGAGNYHFLENPQSVARVLSREFEASQQVVAGGIELHIPLKDTIQLLSAGGYPITMEGDTAIIRIGDLMGGEQRKIFLSYQVPTAKERNFSLGTIRARYAHMDQSLQVSSPTMGKISCIDNSSAVLASIDKKVWSQQVVQEDYGRLQEEVATAIREGKEEEAMKTIEEYEDRTSAVNSSVGSEIVRQNLNEEVQLLKRDVADTFGGTAAGVAEKKAKVAKTLQYRSYTDRRDKK